MGIKVMDEYEPIQVESAIGNDEAIWLYEQAKCMSSIVELGSYKGKSTHALLSGCKGVVYAVDHFKGSPDGRDTTYGKSGKEEFLYNTKNFNNLVLLETDTVKASKIFEDQSIDMIFIDASHLYEDFLNDMTNWFSKITKLICGHDIGYPAIMRVLTELNLNWEVVEIGSLWRLI